MSGERPTSQLHCLNWEGSSEHVRRHSSLGVEGAGEDDGEVDSNDGHSESGQRFIDFENAPVQKPTRVSDQLVAPVTDVVDVEGPSLHQSPTVCVALGVVSGAQRVLELTAKDESSLQPSERTSTVADLRWRERFGCPSC